MALTLHFHPLASFCHKVLIALYENGASFDARIVDLMDPDQSAALLDLWPAGKIPVLRDENRNRTIPETTIIIEYLEHHYPSAQPLFPRDEPGRLEARLWDRFYDCYVQAPMQKIVADRLRPEDERDPRGVKEARANLNVAYAMVEKRMANRTWAAGDGFTVADCAAAPALFYAGIVAPFPESHIHLAAYFERLLNRASVQRTLDEARPWFHMFPYRDAMPERFL